MRRVAHFSQKGIEMERKAHWEDIHRTKTPGQVSWFQEHALQSLDIIRRTGIDRSGRIIDVGGGISTLVDDLLADGFENITVLDISSAAMDVARQRLGKDAARVRWVEADITQASLPPRYYDVWHDRATFHFLTNPEDRQKYVLAVQHAVRPGGHVIVATFAQDGPAQCSGLDVVQYNPESLHDEFGADFELVDSARSNHVTPFGTEQRFLYCYCRVR
jgi:2-polyprenyl-3-methyl-5-hydroxy-6-metoxy-1,4-benzoquinol methylase